MKPEHPPADEEVAGPEGFDPPNHLIPSVSPILGGISEHLNRLGKTLLNTPHMSGTATVFAVWMPGRQCFPPFASEWAIMCQRAWL